MPDTCLKTKTHFVKKPLPVSTTSSHHISNKLGGVSQTVSRKPSSSSALETDETDDVSSCENSVSCTSETVILSDNSLSSLALDKKSKKKKKKKKKKQKPRKRKSEGRNLLFGFSCLSPFLLTTNMNRMSLNTSRQINGKSL